MNTVFDFYRSPITKSKLLKQDDKLIDNELNLFPIINNIPRFVPIDNYSSSFGFQWNIFNKTQIDIQNNSNISKIRFYKSTKWKKDDLLGKKVLEVGSGSGRFTQIILETGADLYSFDYSSAVEANQKNNSFYNNLNLSQASIYEMPFDSNLFDFVCCLGVIQHTPNVELSFSCMVDVLKPGGQITIDVYAMNFKTIFHTKYWVRPLTKRINKIKLLNFIKWYVPKWLPISNLLIKVPFIGKFLAQIIPVVNFSQQFPMLNKEQQLEWSILDTFDMLSPEYDNPQSISTLKKWILKYNLEEIYCGKGDNGYVLIAKKK